MADEQQDRNDADRVHDENGDGSGRDGDGQDTDKGAGDGSTQTRGGEEVPQSHADSRVGGDTGASAAFQVTFDAKDPEQLASFWASALGYQTAPAPEGFDSWPSFLDSVGVPEDKRDSAWALVDPQGVKPRLFFQKVPEDKTAKNRVHLDIHATLGMDPGEVDERREEAVGRLESLGATRHDQHSEMGVTWVVMTDPEGNEFCVS
jgi:hypothetical protein